MPSVKAYKTFFFEADEGTFYTQMPLGIERVMQELLESRLDEAGHLPEEHGMIKLLEK